VEHVEIAGMLKRSCPAWAYRDIAVYRLKARPGRFEVAEKRRCGLHVVSRGWGIKIDAGARPDLL